MVKKIASRLGDRKWMSVIGNNVASKYANIGVWRDAELTCMALDAFLFSTINATSWYLIVLFVDMFHSAEDIK